MKNVRTNYKIIITIFTLGIVFFCLATGKAVDAKGYGINVLSRLVKFYPNHFSILNNNGKLVIIDETSPLGSHLVSVFSNPLEIGWIQWWGREPVDGNKEITAMCYIHGDDKGVEILFHKSLSVKNYPHEEFWRAIIFECYNAQSSEKFLILQKQKRTHKITKSEFAEKTIRIEFKSATKAQKFQNQVWIPFCKLNNLPFSNRNWFFKEGSSFDEWIAQLNSSKEGRNYFSYYQFKIPEK